MPEDKIISLDPFKYFVLLDVDGADGRAGSTRAMNIAGGGCLVSKSYENSEGHYVEVAPVYIDGIRAVKIPDKQSHRYPSELDDPEVWEDLYELKGGMS